MALTKEDVVDKIEVLEMGQVQVPTATRVLDNEEIANNNHGYEHETILEETATIYFLVNQSNIRTTEKRHHKSVSDLWDRLVRSGDIYLSKYKGWYSVSDEAYYNSDEIIEKNGKRYSTFSGSLVEWVEEESFFFKLSSWQNRLLEFYDKKYKCTYKY